jgi:SAM-dependent methyltransferase
MSIYGERVLPRLINVVMNTAQTREIRERVCRGLTGEVVEIGFGTGHNLPFLPPTVRSLKAVEPAGLGVRLAQSRIAAASAPVEVVGLDGQQLPLDDDSADAVLCTWSLCGWLGALRGARRRPRPRRTAMAGAAQRDAAAGRRRLQLEPGHPGHPRGGRSHGDRPQDVLRPR